MALSEAERDRVRDLIHGRAEPTSGFERHFLTVVFGDSMPHSEAEKVWYRYALIALIQETEERAATHRRALDENAREQVAVLSTPGSYLDAELAEDVWKESDLLLDAAGFHREEIEVAEEEISYLEQRLERLLRRNESAAWVFCLTELREEDLQYPEMDDVDGSF